VIIDCIWIVQLVVVLIKSSLEVCVILLFINVIISHNYLAQCLVRMEGIYDINCKLCVCLLPSL